MAGVLPRETVKHGSQIFAYYNIRTNQVVYSLTRALNNHAALKQLPILGKKTVPAALRKDLWTPLCLLTFPRPAQGLSVWRKLREFRRLHELAYPLEIITQTEGPHKGQLMPKKKRARVLMDQRANSVADMAAVLLLQERPPSEEEVAYAEKFMAHGRPRAKRGLGSKLAPEALPESGVRGSVDGVVVHWAEPLDAEFAPTWPSAVLHARLGRSRYTAAWPLLPDSATAESSSSLSTGTT